MDSDIVVLCGGKGTRIKTVSKNVPKSLIKVKGKPFLEYKLNKLEKFDFKNLYLCTGYKSYQIKKFIKKRKNKLNTNICNDGKELLGTGGAIKKIINKLSKFFFVTYGDIYDQINYELMLKEYKKKKLPVMMSIIKNKNKLYVNNVDIIDNKFIFYNKKGANFFFDFIDYGVIIFKKKIFTEIKEKKFQLEDLIHNLSLRRQISFYVEKKNFYEIGSIDGLKNFNNFCEK